MAATFKYLFPILFLTLIVKGSCECSINNINIGTTRSGRVIQGQPEWNVVVINNCTCTQSQIRLSCKGFKTSESVSPSILSIEGDSCLLINGNPLNSFATVRFSYAWDPPFLLLPTSSSISC
ncbi:hypothetical protein AAZX31_10G108500 [Glycine max]|uniref:Uncharacterized protein n=2 Tax=Glycine subgen. Soja TaxID=1462606 RepID=I1L9Y5_SOYBN|nr:uncharacterized protein LOC100818721 [Glycine max]XP_028182585.1 uncharacterized protein LOC114369556 [Glycine soja]KAG4982922.1 hypothetical protein JHK87_027671 [Glycine soja]KAG4996978.1 hypothetical protein JHK85_028417 [Glycine max]KAG5003755.1 hypothetical protein JHK86_027894 [Glycine max]KAG5126930.1 hypothetical protein JHK82_027765 [Glycine max]KAG5151539.1 hypothetical protein JHK84_028011 [Glycine max]|eukprot:XP_003535865.1 uncharacterized protein LOC100818721 [Glycine max]